MKTVIMLRAIGTMDCPEKTGMNAVQYGLCQMEATDHIFGVLDVTIQMVASPSINSDENRG